MHRSRRVRSCAAGNPAIDDDLVELLLGDAVDVVRLSAASNLSERPALQPLAARSPDAWVRAVLAHTYRWHFDRSLSYDVQSALASDDFFEVRFRIAETTNYLDIFESLMADEEPRVRAGCASNPRISRDQMELLITDRRAVVRQSAAANGLLFPDDDQLVRLATDRSASVRWNVIFRVDRPRRALELIAADDDEVNSRHARAALNDPHQVIAPPAESGVRLRRTAALGATPFESPPASGH